MLCNCNQIGMVCGEQLSGEKSGRKRTYFGSVLAAVTLCSTPRASAAVLCLASPVGWLLLDDPRLPWGPRRGAGRHAHMWCRIYGTKPHLWLWQQTRVLARHFYFMPNIPGMKYGEDMFLGDKLNTKK